jgi:hypothetical protein
VKGESNHWIAMKPRSRGTILETLTVYSFEDSGPDFQHYCSPACAGKRFNEFLDELRKQSIDLANKIAEDHEQDARIAAGLSGASACRGNQLA